MADAAVDERRIGQEGSRWFNAPPTGKELADWFEKNVQVHDKLDSDHYVQGITMIPNTDKAKTVVGWDAASKAPVIESIENLVFTPYAKVETRIKYFNDLMAQMAEEWLGVIEPVTPTTAPPGYLTPGFFPFSVNAGEKGTYRYIACSMKVTVFKRDTVEWKEWRNTQTGQLERRRIGETIIDAAPGTKMVPMMGRYDPDPSSLMKAETGAIGRALGMAGMLVIPGTGVATAEDMQEALGGERQAAVPEDQQLPPDTPQGAATSAGRPSNERETITDMQQQTVMILNTLKAEFPDTFENYRAWAQERGIGQINEVTEARVLQGMLNKADRELTNERGKKAKADGGSVPDPKPNPPKPQDEPEPAASDAE